MLGRPLSIAAVVALIAAAAACGQPEGTASEPEGASAAAPRELPDGTTATAAQDAYLDAVEPHLSPARASDVLDVLSSGEDGVCGVFRDPSDPAAQVQAVELLMDASGYNLTEATVIARAAGEHLCP